MVDITDPDWQNTPAGYSYNHKYGFGTIDTYRLIQAAKTWRNANSQTRLSLPIRRLDTLIPDDFSLNVTSSVFVSSEMLAKANMTVLEHVTVTVTITHERRGDVNVVLISPNNIKSVLLPGRPLDESHNGFRQWNTMTLAHW
jgi:kexin